jgi:DnaJ-class molecular chaperone
VDEDTYFPECPTCGGKGANRKYPNCCPDCGGRGYIVASRKAAEEYVRKYKEQEGREVSDGADRFRSSRRGELCL